MRDGEGFPERIERNARDLAGVAGARAIQLARAGRLQLDLLGIQREMQREFRDLGERALELIRRSEASRIELDPIAEQILQRISRLEAEKIEREQQLVDLRAGSSRVDSPGPFDRTREGSR